MKTEIWKRVKLGYQQYDYYVSNLGRVKNSKGQVLKPWLRGQRKGTYPCVGLCKGGKRLKVDVHRLVAIHFVPNPEGKPEVNHLDLNHLNARADNLEWCTRAENMQHRFFMTAHLHEEVITA